MLFGTGSAKFERSGSIVTLEHSNLAPNYAIRNISVITSVYDHFHTYDFLGDYSEFTVQLNLWKYQSLTETPSDKYNEIYPFLYTLVYFWPHEDGQAVSGSDDEHMPFFIDSIQHSYLFGSQADANEDVLFIHFKSEGYTNLTGSLV